MMKCPVCNDVRMREVEKDGVLIDVCPDCKGVWLDRGELDKLLSEVREIRPAFNEWYDKHDDNDHKHYRNDDNYRPSGRESDYDKRNPQHGQGYHKKKKKSVLDVFGDLFD